MRAFPIILLATILVFAGGACGEDDRSARDGGRDSGQPSTGDAGPDGGGTPDAGTDGGGDPQPDDGGPGTPDAGPLGGGDWRLYRGNDGTWTAPGTFTAAQAVATERAWSTDAGPYGYSQPLIVGDSVFVTTGFEGRVLALEADTGQLRWSRTLDHLFSDDCSSSTSHPGFWGSPAYFDGVLYAAAPDGKVYALNPSTGATLRSSTVASTTNPPELIQSSPSISAESGELFVGVASLFNCHHIPGRVIAVDLDDGTSRSVTLTENGQAGAGVWSSIAVDDAADRLYVTTGDPVGVPLAEMPYAQSILALDRDTFTVLDHWQNPGPAPEDNRDFGASPTLLTGSDGTPLVAAASKDGMLYVFRRSSLSAGPLWQRRLAISGPDPLAGEGSLVSPTFGRGLLIAAGGETEGGDPGSVVALDPLTGAVAWTYPTPGFVMAGMPLLGEVLLVSSIKSDQSESYLDLVDVRDGTRLNRFTSNGPAFGAPVVGHGLILRFTYSGLIEAFRIGPQ